MDINEDQSGMTTSAIPANRTGSPVVGTGDDSQNMTWAKQKKKPLRSILTQRPITRKTPVT